LTDGSQNLQIAFGMRRPEVVCVRPDGYIGFGVPSLIIQESFEYLGLIYGAIDRGAGTEQTFHPP
jgi:hypothetical protein